MKNYFIVLSILIITFTSLFVSCKKDDEVTALTYDLYTRYWNAEDEMPQMRFNEGYSSDVIRMRYEKEFTVVKDMASGSVDTILIIDNVRFVDNNFSQYKINAITPFFLNEKDDWQPDLVYEMTYEKIKDTIDLILLIDKSYSLGEDFSKVKDYAKETVNYLFSERNDSVKIGVVDFSDNVTYLNLTNNQQDIINYIDALENNGQTAFYAAMDTAINKLIADSLAKSRVILGFTDGIDNKSLSSTSASLINRFSTDSIGMHITSYMIGLQGNGEIDKKALSDLSVNGGMYQFPTDMITLQSSFKTFADIISNVYNLYYTRNNQLININSKKYLKFAFELE